jgi:oligopeptide transport system ATP-binding protein
MYPGKGAYMEMTSPSQAQTTLTVGQSPLLEAHRLIKHFETKRAAFGARETLRAVDGIDFAVGRDKVFSLVGESGCGKSTVARLVLRLLDPTAGEIKFKGENIHSFSGEKLRAFRRSVQIIFQDPFASLNPRRTVFDTIAEPLKIHNIAEGTGLKDKVAELLEKVGLHDVMGRYPHEFSGGQRQRICIARSLAVSPELIVADEPLSALDVSIQAQTLNLLMDLKRERQLSYLFISHDLRVVEYLSDEVSVMYLGRIVESGPTEDIFANPLHPYTEVLLSAAPSLTPGAHKRTPLGGEVPSPIDIPPGCPFHPRCPKRFEPCDKIVPELRSESGRPAACHLRNSYAE